MFITHHRAKNNKYQKYLFNLELRKSNKTKIFLHDYFFLTSFINKMLSSVN